MPYFCLNRYIIYTLLTLLDLGIMLRKLDTVLVLHIERKIEVCVLDAQSCPTLWGPWTVICQAPLSMGFSRQEYWSGLSFPPPRDLPSSGIKPTSPVSPALQADSLRLSHQISHSTNSRLCDLDQSSYLRQLKQLIEIFNISV